MAGHGSKPLRGLESTQQSSIQTGKFGRLFRWLEPALAARTPSEEKHIKEMLELLASLMVSSEFSENVDGPKHQLTPDADLLTPEPVDENITIAAGYTYFGQFIDHDTTFDPASSLQQQNDPDALVDFRTPRLDLDCIYGRGPADQPYLYARPGRHKFILGEDRGVAGMHRPDLHRTLDGTAILGDKRNDENKIVAQIQALFLKFHNKVFDQLAPDFGVGENDLRFAEAQRIVRWTYQWLVLTDFLPKICDASVISKIMPSPGKRAPNLDYYHPHDGDAFIPVEFSVAAYRFGHSMVRPSYSLNDSAKSFAKFTSAAGKVTGFARIPIFVAHATASTDAMNGFGELAPALPNAWGIDWTFFFGTPINAPKGTKQIPQPSYRIDATLVDPLGKLPEFTAAHVKSPFQSLAFRNLMRGASMGLPSGQRVADMMNVVALTDKQLWHLKGEGDVNKPWPEGKIFLTEHKRWLEGAAPLWFYILKEAEILHRGHHLGPVGSRIVGETLIGLVWFDHFSYLFQKPQWTPATEGLLGLGNVVDMLTLTAYVD